MEQVIELDGDSIRILGLSRDGIWLPFFEIQITRQTIKTFRLPLLLKIEDHLKGHISQLNDQFIPEGERIATPQS